MRYREMQRNELSLKARKALIMFKARVTSTDAAKALGISRMTLWRGLRALERDGISAAPPAAPAAPDNDPLLDGWEPQTVEPVTDSDIDPLLG